MADTHTEINQRFPLPISVPAVNIVCADFKLERCRDTVTGLIPVFFRCLPMFVQIDETRCDDKTRGVEVGFTGEWRCGNGSDLPCNDPDIADCVKA